MTEKELKKLNRYQLLEMLIIQTERAEKFQKKLELMEAKLNDRDIHMTALGSVAEASLQLSGVFEAAQNAADRYLEEAHKRGDEIVNEARKQAKEIIAEAEMIALAIGKSGR